MKTALAAARVARPSALRTALLLVPFLAFGACRCDPGNVTSADAKIEVFPGDSLDLGKVRVGDTKSVDVVLTSRGRVAVALKKVDREGLSADWWLGQAPAQLPPDVPQKITLTFAPADVGPQAGTLVFRTDSEAVPELRVAVKGEGVRTNVVIEPAALEFGAVEVGAQEVKAIHLRNDGPIGEDVRLTALADGSPHFRVGPVPGDGEVIHLDPGTAADLPVTFAPQLAEAAASTVELQPCTTCDVVTVPLSGLGVASLLSLEPADCLDFGEVNPGSRVTRPIAVKNAGNRGLSVLGATFAAPSDVFAIDGTFPVPVPGGDAAAVTVAFAPTSLAASQSSIVITTDDPAYARATVCVKGRGGGPDLAVAPAALAFGNVAVGTSLTKTVRVSNVGAGSGQTPLAVTRASVRSGTGPFSPAAASISLTPGHSATLSVTFSPTAAGAASDVLVLETNDADSPTREIPLTGTGRVLPPCQLETVPATTLAFGNVAVGRTATLPLALRNTGPGDCLVHDLMLDPGTDPAFSLVGGAHAEETLAAGAVLTVSVTFSPTALHASTGGIGFRVSDPVSPERHVALTGTSAKGCLLIAPDELDFGTVAPACTSRDRVVNVYNTCGTPVKVEGVTLAVLADQPFALAGLPALPVTLDGSTAPALRVRFHPMSAGTWSGGLFVKSDERPEPYFVALRGHASPDALQRDTYVQERRAQVDVLFVVDNSGSMREEQDALATNFDKFIRYATAHQIDYHLAITTTDMTPAGAHGRFVPLDGSRPKVLTPATPNVTSVFAENVNVGTSGDGNAESEMEAVYQALQPAMLVTDNDGFLRHDAMLSVIVVTDERDYSPKTPDFYYGYFLNIKGASRPEQFTFSAVCRTNPNAGDQYGTTLMEMARRTGGISTDIETSDWATDLQRLGAIAFGYQDTFDLGGIPADPAQIEVRVDGHVVPPTDGVSVNWTYDTAHAAITFDPYMVPEPGSTLEITYPVLCGP